MDRAAPVRSPPPARWPLWAKVLLALGAAVLLLAVVLAFFPWDALRGSVNRYVTDKTGRHFAITRSLDVKLGPTTRILAEGIEFANPQWAKDRYLVKAEGGRIDVRLWPLLRGRIELPLIELRRPQLGLQIEPDGRRSWALGRDTSDPGNIPRFGALVVDQGSMHFIASEHGADIHTEFALDGPLAMPPRQKASAARESARPAPGGDARAPMPLGFQARGTWQKEPFTARGRTGNVLYLSAPLQSPFPMEIEAAAGATRLRAQGSIASLATLEGADAVVELQGKDLADLYKFLGVVLPSTPRYVVHGRLSKRNEVWRAQDLAGKLGNTDVSGELSFDRTQRLPHLTGKLKSNWLDFNDLAPLVGLPQRPGPAARAAQAGRKAKEPRDPQRKMLPRAPLDLARLKAMNSEVAYSAARVTNASFLPLERMAVQVRLQGGVLDLDPLNLGVAGGTLAGKIRIDSHGNPAVAEVRLDARSLEMSKLFRSAQLRSTSFGRILGDFDLKGRGNSVAQMLGSADGNVSLLMGPGQISNLLLELAGLDGAEILKFLVGGDREVKVRCAAAAFDVQKGQMTSRALVLDTTDTVIWGQGKVNLATEQMDLYFKPYPKDKSILSLRSPLKLAGTLGAPDAGPDKKALGERAGLALALGAINPLLALAATIETGPGKDANCAAVLREAASPNSARAPVTAREKASGGAGSSPR